MGSVNNPNSWAPYDSYRDCSQGICNIYCPQWCYIIFPPPPPFPPGDDDSGTNFSPLIIAIIGILASAFLLVAYYTIISKYCKRRRAQNPVSELETNRDQRNHNQWQVGSSGLDEQVIKSITVFKYKRGDGLVEGTECSVCLSEFQENESLRLLPKCSHAFHLPCIDMWLKSHSNCPLCRANVASNPPLPQPSPSTQVSSTLNISSLENHRQNDLILVAEDQERGQEISFGNVNIDVDTKNMVENGDEGMRQIKRSFSMGSFSCQGHLLVSDILRISEDDEEMQTGIQRISTGIGSSRGFRGDNSPVSMKRSVSTGRLGFNGHEKGKNSIIPN